MAKQATKLGQQTQVFEKRYGSSGVPDPGGMNHQAYPHEIGPDQFLWLFNANIDGNSIIPRGGQFPTLDPPYGFGNAMHPWGTHEGAPFRLWFCVNGCPHSPVVFATGVSLGYFDDQSNPRTNGVGFYDPSTMATIVPKDVSLGVFGGAVHVGMNESFRRLEMNFQVPYGTMPSQMGGGNYDFLLKRFEPTEVVRRQYAFDGLYFVFVRVESGPGGNLPTDTTKIYVWDSVAMLIDDITTCVTAGDIAMGVVAADDYLYMTCFNGRIYFRGRGLPPKTWTLLGTAGVPILPGSAGPPATNPSFDGQNGLTAHKGKCYFIDGAETPSVIRSALQPSTITVERTLPAGGVGRTVVAMPRIGIVYPWQLYSFTLGKWVIYVGFYDYTTNTWTDIAKDLTAQDASFVIDSFHRIHATAYYRNRIVFTTTEGQTYISPPVKLYDPTWISGTWTHIDETGVFFGTRMRNYLVV